MNTVTERLLELLDQNGCKGRIIAHQELPELKKELVRLYNDGQINPGFYENYLPRFIFDYSERFPKARSIILIAFPQPIVSLSFYWMGKARHTLYPPGYISQGADDLMEEKLRSFLHEENCTLTRASLPLKLLAVRSGLSWYGRNNISYVEGMGSLNRLAAWVSDLPAGEALLPESRRMPQCDNCLACLKACPTGSISKERKLIEPLTCLTYSNEDPGPFPNWLDTSLNHAVVGCLRCQAACPKNKSRLEPVSWDTPFTEEDTHWLIKEASLDSLPEGLRTKLDRLNLDGYYSTGVLTRNLRLLFEKDTAEDMRPLA